MRLCYARPEPTTYDQMVKAEVRRLQEERTRRYGGYRGEYHVAAAICEEHLIDALVTKVNERVDAAFRARDTWAAETKAEILRLEIEAGHLARFLAGGGDSAAVRDELRTVEMALQARRVHLAEIERGAALTPPRAIVRGSSPSSTTSRGWSNRTRSGRRSRS